MSKVFAIFDVKVEAFLAPMVFPTNGQAIRAFGDTVRKPETTFHMHPEDFQMFYLGEFDDVLGKFVCPTAPVSIASAMEFVNK